MADAAEYAAAHGHLCIEAAVATPAEVHRLMVSVVQHVIKKLVERRHREQVPDESPLGTR